MVEQMLFEWSSSRSAFEVYTIAKQMEKEQITNAWMDGLDHIFHKEAGEEYYKDTFEQ